MALSSIELWQRIAAEGLASPMQCRAWAADAARSMPTVDTTDGVKVLQALIELGRLTNYQAKILAGQSDKPLHRGPWTIVGRIKQPLWNDWLAVTKVDLTKAESPPATWARWLTPDDLQSLKSSAPSLPRGLQMASVSHDNLQPVFVPELAEAELQLQVGPIRGELLTQAFTGNRRAPDVVTGIIERLAAGLAAMHSVGLVHGRVLPDRVYVDGENVMLARDPISALTATLDESAVGLLGEHLEGLRSAQFLAPEFVAPGQSPTIPSDIYAFGCTWWWLLTGKPVADGKSTQQILASHTETVPELPKEIDYPEPLERCLRHCLAKNLDARFASANDLMRALTEALRVVALGKIIPPVSEPPAADKKVPTTASQTKIVPAVVAAEEVTDQAVSNTPAMEPAKSKSTVERNAPSPDRKPKIAKAESTPGKASLADDAEVPAAREDQPATTSKTPIEPVANPTQRQKTSQSQLAASSKSKPKLEGEATRGSSKPKTVASAATPTRRRKSRKRGNKWLLPVAGGCGFVILMLLVLKFSGALEPSGKNEVKSPEGGAYVPPPTAGLGEVIERNPLLDHYNIVEDNGQLWVPPSSPSPLQLDMLPPGGQLFVSFKPASLLSGQRQRALLAAFEEQLTPLLQLVAARCGKPLETMRQVTVGFYTAETSGAIPAFAVRVELLQPTPLSSLKSGWDSPTKAKVNEQELLVTDTDLAYYVAEQPMVDAQSVSVFSVGPVSIMREVAEMGGGSGPLTSQMEALRKRTDGESDLSLLFSPRYIFSEGRGLLDQGPERLRELLTGILGDNTRAALLQTRLDPTWYFEAQIVGASDRDGPVLMANIQSKLAAAPQAIESWFVEESPHTYWRALALRFPQMLRTANDYSRFGVEDGTAVMNVYLAPDAAINLTLASWIAMQEGATLRTNPSSVTVVEAAKPLTMDEYLGRAIRLSFDQEPIEVALSLIGEEANADLPGDTPKLRYSLDGDAFEKGGITRNQQLANFDTSGKSVREALTEVAKRGNPVTTVTDTRDEDQRLIWVITEDPTAPGKKMVSLTTRVAAVAAGIPLPVEFAPASP